VKIMKTTKTSKNKVAKFSESKNSITFSEQGLVFINTGIKFIKDSLFLALRGQGSYFKKKIFVNDTEISSKKVYKFATNNISYINIRKAFRSNKNIMWHVELSLKLKNNKIKIEEINELAKNNNIYEYLKLLPHQLSKLELMKILIFLSIINNDDIILIESAYEKFENNEMQELIDILKNQAKEKLIICVNFAEKAILENYDCEFIETTTTSIKEVKFEGKTYKLDDKEKTKILKNPFSYYNKGIFTKVMMFLANLSMILLFSVFIIFENKKGKYFDFLEYFDLKYAIVDKNNENEKMLPVYTILFPENAYSTVHPTHYIVEIDDFESEKFDLLYGNMASNFKEIVVSNLFAEKFQNLKKLNSIQEVVGKDAEFKVNDNTISLKIAGIYKSEKGIENTRSFGEYYQLVKRGFTINYFNKIDFETIMKGEKIFKRHELKIGENYPNGINFSSIKGGNNLKILLNNGQKKDIKDVNLESHEIVLNINHYNKLFYNDNPKKIDEITNFDSLNIEIYTDGNPKKETKNFKIKGIIYDIDSETFDENYQNSDVLNLIFSNDYFDELYIKNYYDHFLYSFDNKNPSKFFKDNWAISKLKYETDFVITTAYDDTISFYYKTHQRDILSNFWYLVFGIPILFAFKMFLNKKFLKKNEEYFSSLLSAGEGKRNLTNEFIFAKIFESILILIITIISVAPLYKLTNDTDKYLKEFFILNFKDVIYISLFTIFIIGISLIMKLRYLKDYIERN